MNYLLQVGRNQGLDSPLGHCAELTYRVVSTLLVWGRGTKNVLNSFVA